MGLDTMTHRIVFETFDADNDGYLNGTELHAALTRLGGHTTRASALALAALCGGPGTPGLSFACFVALLDHRGPTHAEHTRRAFDALDVDGDGQITAAEVSELFGWLGVSADAEVAAWIAELDTNGDGAVTYEEFAANVRG